MKKKNFDLDDDELKSTKDFLGSLGKLFIIILYLGIITGIVPVLLCVLMEKINLLIIPIALFDLYWIGKEFFKWVEE